jgi:hypothetical protein
MRWMGASQNISPRPPATPLWTWILGSTLATVVVAGGMFALLLTLSPPATERELGGLAVGAVVLTLLLVGSVLAATSLRRQLTVEQAHRVDRARLELERVRQEQEHSSRGVETELTQVGALHARATTAVEQLGHHAPVVRMAGVYALATVADDWLAREDRAEAQTCVDLLCSMLRTPSVQSGFPDGQAGDRQVRQTIVRVVAHRLRPQAAPGWHGMDLDFTDAVFDGRFDFSGAQFVGGRVSFVGAGFPEGIVSFVGASFAGGRVLFDDAQVTSGALLFDRAQFSGAAVTFGAMTVSGGSLRFNQARFSGGEVTFHHAVFAGGAVSFLGAVLSGADVGFDGASFSGAHVRFIGSRFDRKTVRFDRAEFAGGTVSFEGARPGGGMVSFGEALWRGGSLLLGGLRDGDGALLGTWRGAAPPGWPGRLQGPDATSLRYRTTDLGSRSR